MKSSNFKFLFMMFSIALFSVLISLFLFYSFFRRDQNRFQAYNEITHIDSTISKGHNDRQRANILQDSFPEFNSISKNITRKPENNKLSKDADNNIDNAINYNYEIRETGQAVNRYLMANIYYQSKHDSLYKRLKQLFAITNLSPYQNSILNSMIRKLEDFKSKNEKNVIKKSHARGVNRDEISKNKEKESNEEKINKNEFPTNIKYHKIYVVKKKETITSISKKFNISVKDLLDLNPGRIDPFNYDIKAGDTLIIIK